MPLLSGNNAQLGPWADPHDDVDGDTGGSVGLNRGLATSTLKLADTPSRDQRLRGVSVLVIDDAPDVLRLVVAMLRRAGARAEGVESASEALAQFVTHQPDVIVSDIAMPEINGYQLLRAIRSLPKEAGANIPAAALTAYVSVDDRVEAMAAGFQAHVEKPVRAEILITAVAELVFGTMAKH